MLWFCSNEEVKHYYPKLYCWYHGTYRQGLWKIEAVPNLFGFSWKLRKFWKIWATGNIVWGCSEFIVLIIYLCLVHYNGQTQEKYKNHIIISRNKLHTLFYSNFILDIYTNNNVTLLFVSSGSKTRLLNRCMGGVLYKQGR